MAETFKHNETQVMMSPQTAAHYGAFAPEFPIWAETQGIETVIIITPEDILNGQNPEDLSTEQREEALRTFIQENFPDFPLEQFEDKLSSLGRNAAFGQGRAEDIDIDNDGSNDFGIVIAPRRDQTSEEAAARLGGLEPSQVSGIHGTALEWQIMTIAHEIGHLSQPGKSDNMNLVWEIEAEQDMVEFAKNAFEKGLFSDPKIADDFTHIRNLKGFYFKSDLFTHVVGAGVQTPSEGHAPTANNDLDFADPLHKTQMQVAYDVGQSLINDEHKIEALDDMLRNKGIYSFDSRRLPEMEVADRKIIVDIMRENISLEEGLAQLPENVREKIEENFHAETEVLGIGALKDDPSLMYETTKRLYLDGAFDENLIGKQYAFEFLTGAQKYAPEYFGVENVDEIFEPPQFPQADKATPHIHVDHTHSLVQP